MIELTWVAVTFERCDGHPIDGYFMTNQWDEIRAFTRTVYPLRVDFSTHRSARECAWFLAMNFIGFQVINPSVYCVSQPRRYL